MKKRCGPRFKLDNRNAPSQFLHKIQAFTPSNTRCFDCDRYEIDVLGQISIFAPLFGFCLGSYRTSYIARGLYVRWSKCIWACGVPSQAAAFLPWNRCDAIWTLSIRTETQWFSSCENRGTRKSSLHNVIDLVVPCQVSRSA